MLAYRIIKNTDKVSCSAQRERGRRIWREIYIFTMTQQFALVRKHSAFLNKPIMFKVNLFQGKELKLVTDMQ